MNPNPDTENVVVGHLEKLTMSDGTRMGSCPLCGAVIAHYADTETATCPRCGTDWICTPEGEIVGAA